MKGISGFLIVLLTVGGLLLLNNQNINFLSKAIIEPTSSPDYKLTLNSYLYVDNVAKVTYVSGDSVTCSGQSPSGVCKTFAFSTTNSYSASMYILNGNIFPITRCSGGCTSDSIGIPVEVFGSGDNWIYFVTYSSGKWGRSDNIRVSVNHPDAKNYAVIDPLRKSQFPSEYLPLILILGDSTDTQSANTIYCWNGKSISGLCNSPTTIPPPPEPTQKEPTQKEFNSLTELNTYLTSIGLPIINTIDYSKATCQFDYARNQYFERYTYQKTINGKYFSFDVKCQPTTEPTPTNPPKLFLDVFYSTLSCSDRIDSLQLKPIGNFYPDYLCIKISNTGGDYLASNYNLQPVKLTITQSPIVDFTTGDKTSTFQREWGVLNSGDTLISLRIKSIKTTIEYFDSFGRQVPSPVDNGYFTIGTKNTDIPTTVLLVSGLGTITGNTLNSLPSSSNLEVTANWVSTNIKSGDSNTLKVTITNNGPLNILNGNIIFGKDSHITPTGSVSKGQTITKDIVFENIGKATIVTIDSPVFPFILPSKLNIPVLSSTNFESAYIGRYEFTTENNLKDTKEFRTNVLTVQGINDTIVSEFEKKINEAECRGGNFLINPVGCTGKIIGNEIGNQLTKYAGLIALIVIGFIVLSVIGVLS